MSSLATLQRDFMDALFEDAEAPWGIAVYRRNVQSNLHDALAAAYPAVRRLVGEGFFREAARRYSREHPSRSADLHEYGAQLARFLASYPHASTLPYLADVARLEWACHECLHAADAGSLDYAALGRGAAERHGGIRFVLHPAVRLVGCGGGGGAEGAPRVEGRGRATSALRVGMLAERIAKLHAQVGQGILAERSKRALVATIRDFDATLKAVTASAPPGEIRDNYLLLSLLWNDYREFALRAPTRENARKLRERNEEVAWIAAKGARMIQEHARATTNGSAGKAGGAGLLSQRLCKPYLGPGRGARGPEVGRGR